MQVNQANKFRPREMTLGFVDLLRDDFIEKGRARGMAILIVKTSGRCYFVPHVWHLAFG